MNKISAPRTGIQKRKKVALALQGGGSWGAFSWGALDELLADPDIEITEISGTSAGAVSGSIVAHALNSASSYEEGAAQARKDLDRFWNSVCDNNHELMTMLAILQGSSPFAGYRDPVKDPNLPALTWIQNNKSLMEANPFLKFSGLTGIFNRAVEDTASRKLRRLIREFIPSYDKIREGKRIKLHVNAAELTDKGLVNRTFSGNEVSIDAVMASATLKGLFEPVDIDGKKYFDGAYAQNPPVDQYTQSDPAKRNYDDVIWIMANPPKGDIRPRHQNEIPHTDLKDSADLILHHAYDHLAYNVINETPANPKSHVIWFNAPKHYNQTSKQNTEAAFLHHLKKEGKKAAGTFLGRHKRSLGHKTTVNLPALQKEGYRRKKSVLWPDETHQNAAKKTINIRPPR